MFPAMAVNMVFLAAFYAPELAAGQDHGATMASGSCESNHDIGDESFDRDNTISSAPPILGSYLNKLSE